MTASVIVPLTVDRLEATARLHAECFPESPWSGPTIATLTAPPTGFGLLACRFVLPDQPPGLLIGFALMRAAAGEAELLSIGVAPAGRGCGIGMQLLEAVLAEAARRGAETAFLEVAAGNDAALRLYARAGFSAVGLRRNYYGTGVDAVIASKPLSR